METEKQMLQLGIFWNLTRPVDRLSTEKKRTQGNNSSRFSRNQWKGTKEDNFHEPTLGGYVNQADLNKLILQMNDLVLDTTVIVDQNTVASHQIHCGQKAAKTQDRA